MKNISNIFIILFLSLFSSASMMGQNPAFVYLTDMTGYSLEDSEDHLKDSLMAAAETLRAELPDTAMQNDFAVYDMGFYSHHAEMTGGVQKVMADAISYRITHSYYLLFGREMNREGRIKKVWVEVELPEGPGFDCWSETKWLLSINSIEFFIDSLVNEEIPDNIAMFWLLTESINKVKQLVESIQSCCNSNFTICSECPDANDILRYYRAQGYYEDKIEILLDNNGFSYIFETEEDPTVLNFSKYIYRSKDEYMPESFDKVIDPFNSLLWEIEGLNAPEDYVTGVILSNDDLCSFPPIAAIRSSNQEAIDLFNSGFEIEGSDLVIVKHLWQNPDGSGDDLLFSNYLYASSGSLEEIPVPLNPAMLNGQSTPTIYYYPLTDPNSPNAYEGMYEIAPDENGTYFGWRIVNGEWMQFDTVEVRTPYPSKHDPPEYLIGQQTARLDTLAFTMVYLYPLSRPTPIYITKKMPCRFCYDYSIGRKKNTATNTIISRFYWAFGKKFMGFQAERDIVFNSFIYGEGQMLIWPPESSVSEAILLDDEIKERIDKTEYWLIDYLINNGDFNGISNSMYKDTLLIQSSPNPSFFEFPYWSLAMFGGTQGRIVKIVKYKEKPSQYCSGKLIKVKFTLTFVDNFGLGEKERWWIPGLPWQWVLQHYRNAYCCNHKAFHPIVYHLIEFEREFSICIN